MTKFVLVRHGEATYDELIKLGFSGYGFSLAPLTTNGIRTIKELSNNSVFSNSNILISSPYTRALETASIIGNKINKDIIIEIGLHEWIPDLTNSYNTVEEFTKNIRIAKDEWNKYLTNPNLTFNEKIESLKSVRERALSTLSKYYDYDKVIVVSHGLLISMLFDEKVRLKPGEFIETTSNDLDKIKVLRR